MEGIRSYQAAVASRSLTTAVILAILVAIIWRQLIPVAALLAGSLIGLTYLFHIAGSFHRLVKGGKRYLPFLRIESVVRVLIAGAAPFLIVGDRSTVGYFTYLAGFVAPLAVAILQYRQQISNNCNNAAAPQG
jgi:hypothetical protein